MMIDTGRRPPGARGRGSTISALAPLLSPSEWSERFAMVSLEGSSSGIEILRANTPYLAHQLTVGEYHKQGFVGTPI
jgi:hypothetical protein